jgi:hypothetical protein
MQQPVKGQDTPLDACRMTSFARLPGGHAACDHDVAKKARWSGSHSPVAVWLCRAWRNGRFRAPDRAVIGPAG